MNNITKFYKISKDNYINSLMNIFPNIKKEEADTIYNNIKLPKRATKFSAGYDFFSPFSFDLDVGDTITIPTGIKARMNNDLVLLIFPRSSLGFKYRLQLDNTIGVIDSDYFDTENEGHIFVKITNDNKYKKLRIEKDVAFCQSIFVKYYLCSDDDTNNKRIGGIGSTDESN